MTPVSITSLQAEELTPAPGDESLVRGRVCGPAPPLHSVRTRPAQMGTPTNIVADTLTREKLERTNG